jgi:saccharopine dehydrogenase (NAD+, L-lysine-forming)
LVAFLKKDEILNPFIRVNHQYLSVLKGNMEEKTFLILGGYGTTGRIISRLLLQETDCHLVLAGRSHEKAVNVVAEHNAAFEGQRVSARVVDAADVASLEAALEGVDFLVLASSTAQYTGGIAKVALAAGVDYLDLQYSKEKLAILQEIEQEIKEAGRYFITDGGFHPGLPAVLVRYSAGFFDQLTAANVGSVIKVDWSSLSLSESTYLEFLDEIHGYESLVFKEGQWVKTRMQGMMDIITMDFGAPFGEQYCVPMFLEEMRPLPELYPSLRETGFFVGGFNWFVDWVVFPLAMAALKFFPRRARKPCGRLLIWGLNAFSKPPYGTVLKLEAQGIKDAQLHSLSLSLSHEDGYVLTAIPVVACLLQYLDGSLPEPGLWTQANIVDPERMLRDVGRLGVVVGVQESEG